MRTSRWTRSPRGRIFGVCAGLAEWRDLPIQPVEIIVFLSILFTGIFPGAMLYLIAALVIPLQRPEDIIDDEAPGRNRRWNSHRSYHRDDTMDANWQEAKGKSNDDLKEEYENLKSKVENMESQMFDKEKDWDARFNAEGNKGK